MVVRVEEHVKGLWWEKETIRVATAEVRSGEAGGLSKDSVGVDGAVLWYLS